MENKNPKFEKVNEHTIRATEEVSRDYQINDLLRYKKQIEERLAQLTEKQQKLETELKYINTIFDRAAKLGMVIPSLESLEAENKMQPPEK
jgi:DNA repair ATPase RecN